jgi:hypothetical protein
VTTSPTLHLLAELRAVRRVLRDALEQQVDAETIAALEIDEANVLEALFDGGEVGAPVRHSFVRRRSTTLERCGGWKHPGVPTTFTAARAATWLEWGAG